MMDRTKQIRCGLCILLSFLLVFGGFPTGLYAREGASALTETSEKYVDARDGSEIADASVYSEEYEEQHPQDIKGYTYVEQSRAVEQIYSHKDIRYIIGYPDKTVQPENELTRAEAVVIFYRLYDGIYPDFKKRMTGRTYSDVKAGAWYYDELETLYNIGILEDVFEKKFSPGKPITRAELAAIAAQFSGLEYRAGEVFSDVPRDHWAYSYILSATAKGWLKGYKDGTFRPDQGITRMETMTLINRVINRSVTVEKLRELKVKNPYRDLPESYWGYCDVMEATIRHNGAQWHGTDYNGGVFNVITERFTDTHGNEIAKPVTTKGKASGSAPEIPAYDYLGYIRTITYIYSKGSAAPYLKKSADRRESYAGDTITYHILAGNGEKATDDWKNVKIRDEIPEGTQLVDGTVYLNGTAAEYTIRQNLLTVNAGDIPPGGVTDLSFKVKVGKEAFNKRIRNTARASGQNGDVQEDEYTASDEGVLVARGETRPFIRKESDHPLAEAGDKVTYTITFGNDSDAEYRLENATVTDEIPKELELTEGSVRLDGKTVKYSFTEDSGVLQIETGDIGPGETHKVTFTARVRDNAYGKRIRNTAVLGADNIEPLSSEDQSGIQVGEGETAPKLSKEADSAKAKAGDTLTYRITAENEKSATVPIEDAVITDVLPQGLDFEFGSVRVNGESFAGYTFDRKTGELTIRLGTLAPGEKKEAAFEVTVNGDAYNRTIENLATLTGRNMDPLQCRDAGVRVADGKASLSIRKTASSQKVKVGDSLTYTVTLANPESSEVDVRDSVFEDTIPEELNFTGSLLVDGKSAIYSYDAQSRLLTVNTGSIAPGQTKTVRISGVVNSTAYGKTIRNTASVRGENAEKKTASDEGVAVEPGSADGHAGVKTADRRQVKAGDTVTYSIRLTNGAGATADWTDARVVDPLPKYLTFEGNVRVNGTTSSAYAYDTSRRTLTLTPDPIPPGETITYQFDVRISDGAQGESITNTAVLENGNGDSEPIPAQSLDVDAGEVIPSVTKKADRSTVKPGDFIRYTVTASNKARATASWKNVSLTDVLPEGTEMANYLLIDGEVSVYSMNNDAIDVKLGDIAPGESITVEYDVKVRDSAAGTTLRNVAILRGENAEMSATDRSVTVEKQDPEPSSESEEFHIEKTADKTLVNLDSTEEQRKVTYTVTVSNNSTEKTWKNVSFRDLLDTGKVILMDESLYLNGRNLSKSGYSLENGREMMIHLGDIAPGESKVIRYTLRFKNDASSAEEYTNTASASGDNGEAGSSYTVSITGNPLTTEEHLQLFTGTQVSANGPLYFWPNNNEPYKSIATRDVCRTIYRSLTVKARNELLEKAGGQAKLDSLSSFAQREDKEIQFFLALGAISENELDRSKLKENEDYFGYTWTGSSGNTTTIYTIVATRDYMGRCLRAVGLDTSRSGKGYSDTSKSNRTSRLAWAEELCMILGRDTDPDTNGLPLKQYQDTAELSARQKQIVNEVSNWHLYTLDNRGKETWVRASGNTV